MRVVFRTEGNHRQGMGDVMSSIAMAAHCRRPGDASLFILSEGAEAVSLIGGSGCSARILPTVEEQVEEIRKFEADVVVLNMLNNSAEFVRALRSVAPLLVTIDDTGEGARQADLRINVLYHTPDSITDPNFIALRDEFQAANRAPRAVAERVGEILIMQGGADTYGFLPQIIQLLVPAATLPHITLITGPVFEHERELIEAVSRSPFDVTVVKNCRAMAAAMLRADLAITAGGISMFECACVGTPAIVVCAERFEVETAARFDAAGIVRNLGFGGDLQGNVLADEMISLMRSLEARKRMSALGKKAIDGRGAERVINLLRSRVADRTVAS